MIGYKARRTPIHRGPTAWSAILPAQAPPIVLESDHNADVAIIGAGFAGLSAARRLKQIDPKVSVVVLEAGRIAEGAAGRNSGFMIDLPHELAAEDYAGQGVGSDRSMISLNRSAISFANAAVEEYDVDRNFFVASGKVNGAADEKADDLNRSYAAHLSTLGEPSELLDRQAMTELTGSRHYVSGLYTPGTVLIQPAGYVRGLAEGLRREGIAIYENSAVLKLERASGHWSASTSQHCVRADKVILANNGHIESFGIATGRLMHIFLYASMTAELSMDQLKVLGGQPSWGVTPADPMGTTVRRIRGNQGGNRIVTRTCASFCPNMETSEATLSRAAKVHRQKFAERFPEIRDAPMEFSWADICASAAME
jgi:glycine/D-amino acid oxidase-like deaminating enzyme